MFKLYLRSYDCKLVSCSCLSRTCLHCPLLVHLSPGTEILTVQAADNDDPKTDNVRIFYRLVGQIPESPRALFRVDRDSGVISVQADSMEGTAPQYTLTITAEDAKGDFGSMQNTTFLIL